MAGHGYLSEYEEGYESDEGRERGFMLGERGRRAFTAPTDEHYLSWRDRHMRELDRDYEEYRRERAQQFHADFSAWRQQRYSNPPPLQPGLTQTGTTTDPTGTLELTTEAQSPAEGGQDPMATATLGTTSSGRGKR